MPGAFGQRQGQSQADEPPVGHLPWGNLHRMIDAVGSTAPDTGTADGGQSLDLTGAFSITPEGIDLSAADAYAQRYRLTDFEADFSIQSWFYTLIVAFKPSSEGTIISLARNDQERPIQIELLTGSIRTRGSYTGAGWETTPISPWTIGNEYYFTMRSAGNYRRFDWRFYDNQANLLGSREQATYGAVVDPIYAFYCYLAHNTDLSAKMNGVVLWGGSVYAEYTDEQLEAQILAGRPPPQN